MRRITLSLIAAAAAGVLVSMAPAARRPDGPAASIYLTEIPQGYRDWKLIAVSRLTAGSASPPSQTPTTMAGPAGASQLRAELGNDVALKAFREGALPFPDGAMIAAIHWAELSSAENEQVLAVGFPGAGIRSFVPGPGLNMQFMVKDSRKYAATGGWGFGDFNKGKPGGEALMKTCFPCHEPAKNHDFVFTRYAP
jgi:hypothetical protein